MKKFKRLFALTTCAVTILTAVACGNANNDPEGSEELKDNAVVEVQLFHPGGYGREFLDKWGEEFAKTYKDKGYTISVTKAEKTIKFNYEITTPAKNSTDLYFTSETIGVNAAIDNSIMILKDPNRVLLEDLTDSFYDSYAIGKDGVEETVKIKDKIHHEALQYTQYYGVNEKWHGRSYLVPWVNAVNGFIFNKDLLCGRFGLEVPVTTEEMLEQFDIIRESGTGIMPVVTAVADAYNWWDYVTNVWWAQYSGAEKWENFYKVIPEEGTTAENGYEIYNDDGMEYAYRTLFQMFIPQNAPEHSGGWDSTFAAASSLNGEVVFFISGDWIAKQMSENFPTEGGAMTMMKTPIISELGVKLRLDGSTSGEADAAKCEEMLRKTVRAIDAGRTNAEIISEITADCGVTLTADKIEALRVARGIYYDLGVTLRAAIPSFSNEKGVALLFLKFMASDDGIEIFRKYAQAGLPFRPTREIEMEMTEMQGSSLAISGGEYAYLICEYDDFSTLRSVAGLQRFNGELSNINLICWNEAVLTAAEKEGLDVRERAIQAAKKFREYEYNWAKDNWASLISIAF